MRLFLIKNRKDSPRSQALSKYVRMYAAIGMFVFIASCNNKGNHELQEIKKLEHYPSASGVEFLNRQLYIIGDDATQLLVLDSNLTKNVSPKKPNLTWKVLVLFVRSNGISF
jgi:hypothetical protein